MHQEPTFVKAHNRHVYERLGYSQVQCLYANSLLVLFQPFACLAVTHVDVSAIRQTCPGEGATLTALSPSPYYHYLARGGSPSYKGLFVIDKWSTPYSYQTVFSAHLSKLPRLDGALS